MPHWNRICTLRNKANWPAMTLCALLSACASSLPPAQTPPPSCPPPPQVPALPAPIAQHSSQPAANYLPKVRAWLQEVESWQQKAAALLTSLTQQ